MSVAPLPIETAIPDLLAALRAKGRAVLQAPPGAGKTTRVPLALLEAAITPQKILMLEPRRLAARASAERMAETLGQPVGQTVGYRIRGESRVSQNTKIEVVTEGILTRLIQSDPELSGIGCVIFDEFHERNLNADLGLALCLEIAELRDDLILLPMSATLDAAPVAALMQAPIITSEGRAFPVEIRHRDRPLGPRERIEDATTETILAALPETEGGVLVFLPGEGEIRRTEAILRPRIPDGIHLRPLFGAMDFRDQRAAIAPCTSGRKIVLATSIAETSLTIEDIRIVVDAGRARRARFDPGSGMSRLVTERVTRAEATQRTGRAGRVAPGLCYRLWTKGEEGALAAFPPPEIETADLAGLALDLALWGAPPDQLPFLTQPPQGALAEAQSLLAMLGALDPSSLAGTALPHSEAGLSSDQPPNSPLQGRPVGQITPHGRALAALPLHPRLGHMLLLGGPKAAPLSALIAERDPLPRSAPVDLSLRLAAVIDPKRYAEDHPHPAHRGTLERIRDEARRLTPLAGPDAPLSPAELAALAYPDRIGQRRKGDAPRYLLSGGKGASLPETDPLALAPFLVVTDTDGNPREATIRQAIPITLSQLRTLFSDQITIRRTCDWSPREARVQARLQETLGALTLEDRLWKDAPPEAIARAMLDGIRTLPLPLSDAAQRFRARVSLVRAAGIPLPDLSDDNLRATLEDWLLPYLKSTRTAAEWKSFDLLPALRACLTWDEHQSLDRAAPASFTTPLGRDIPIDYAGEHPEITLRLQEMFGQTTHPQVAGRPLRVTLLSPGQKPVQTTMDIPGFWDSSYADVRKDMRGRYPRHPWPENPREADPTLRAKPRGT
jgi:ATP-dependent helicase HrpB